MNRYSAVIATFCVVLSACDTPSNQHYLIDETSKVHSPVIGDYIQYNVLDPFNGTSKSATTEWLAETSLSVNDNKPQEFDEAYQIKRSNFTSNSAHYNGLLRGLDDEGNEMMYGLRFGGDTTYWAKQPGANEYGIKILPAEAYTLTEIYSVDANLESCKEFTCSNVGSYSRSITYVDRKTQQTALAEFEVYDFVINETISIADGATSINIASNTLVSIYPPLGEVHIWYTDNELEYIASLANTNIKIEFQTTVDAAQ